MQKTLINVLTGEVEVVDITDLAEIASLQPPELTEKELLLKSIVELELDITPRRLREAVLGIDSGWLVAINEQIATLRERLKVAI